MTYSERASKSLREFLPSFKPNILFFFFIVCWNSECIKGMLIFFFFFFSELVRNFIKLKKTLFCRSISTGQDITMVSCAIRAVPIKYHYNIDRKDMLTCYNIGIEGVFFFFLIALLKVFIYLYIYFLNWLLLIR